MSEMHFREFSKMSTIESYVSAEYSSVGSTIALYTLHFVETKIPCCDHNRLKQYIRVDRLTLCILFHTFCITCISVMIRVLSTE